MKLWLKMIIGLTLGVVVGLLVGPKAQMLKPIGTLFLGLLNMLVTLLVFSSITSGVTSMNDMRKLGRVGLKSMVMIAVTTAIAIVIGLGVAKLVNPGLGLHLVQEEIKVTVQDHVPNMGDLLLSLIPQNPLGALATGQILPIIVFSIILGLAINFSGEKGKPLAGAIESLSSVMFAMTRMVMKFAPIGIFAIMAAVTGSFGIKVLIPLAKLLGAIYFASFVHVVLIFGSILVFMVRVKPMPFFRGMRDALALGASTTSSSATLPCTIHCAQKNLGISENIANFILPLGCTINMNGTAIFQAISAVFIAQAYGIDLSWQALSMIVVTATLSAVGCAGIPGGALVTLSIVLSSAGLPLEGIALVAGIDRLRDIICTMLNVLGDTIVTLYVAKSEGELDEKRYYSGQVVSFEKNAVPEE